MKVVIQKRDLFSITLKIKNEPIWYFVFFFFCSFFSIYKNVFIRMYYHKRKNHTKKKPKNTHGKSVDDLNFKFLGL